MLKDGDRIPSVRDLAISMTINPNTIQRSYKELENEGYIYSRKGAGYFVAPRSETEKNDPAELIARFTDTATELMYLGKSREELFSIIEKIFEGGNINGDN